MKIAHFHINVFVSIYALYMKKSNISCYYNKSCCNQSGYDNKEYANRKVDSGADLEYISTCCTFNWVKFSSLMGLWITYVNPLSDGNIY